MSYRCYRLGNTDMGRTPEGTGRVKDCIKRLSLPLHNLHFTGEDPILVLRFLERFVYEAGFIRMTEGQAYTALPFFLRGQAEDQFNAVSGSARAAEGGITCWPEAVQFLLRSYATNTNTHEAILALRHTQQKPGETETDYSARLLNAFKRCGNVYSGEEKITMFIDGLSPAIRPLVANRREDRLHAPYPEIVHYAKAEGDALPARQGPLGRRYRTMFVDQPDAESLSILRRGKGPSEGVNLASGEVESVATAELPTTVATSVGDDEAVLYGVNVRPQYVPYSDQGTRSARPGRRDNRSAAGTRQKEGESQYICHLCYARGHISPQCNLPVREYARAIVNYESLSPAEPEVVPEGSYHRAKAAHPTVGNPLPPAEEVAVAPDDGKPVMNDSLAHSKSRASGNSQAN